MNDFTKEELTVLQQAFKGSCKAFANDKFDAALEIKIQSMVDSYCDHEWENICCQCTLDKIYCHKCAKSMDEI